MSPCDNPPCAEVGPFRYCPIEGCGWMETPPTPEPSIENVYEAGAALARAIEELVKDDGLFKHLQPWANDVLRAYREALGGFRG